MTVSYIVYTQQARRGWIQRTRVNGVGAYSTLISDQAIVGAKSAIFCEHVRYVFWGRGRGHPFAVRAVLEVEHSSINSCMAEGAAIT